MTATALQQEEHLPEAIVCKWCGKSFHYLKSHISMGRCENIPESAKGLDVDEVVKMYTTAFPDEPTISRTALAKLNEKRAEKHSGEGKVIQDRTGGRARAAWRNDQRAGNATRKTTTGDSQRQHAISGVRAGSEEELCVWRLRPD